MARFFFHLHDDAIVRDEDGLELPDAAAAHREAVRNARALIADQALKGRVDLSHYLRVEDEEGREVLVLPFAEALEIAR
jgi:hypothetical protein